MAAIDNELGALVREYRLKAGMTQLQLSQRLGYESMQFVSLFERGLSKIPLKVMGKMIVILKLPEKKIVKKLTDAVKTEVVNEIKVGKNERQ